MAVGVELNFPGATLAQYGAVVEKMGFRPGGPGAPGGLFHWVTKTDDGFRVIDVWESEEACAQAFQDRIHTAVDTAFGGARPGVEPTVHRLDVLHATLAGRAEEWS